MQALVAYFAAMQERSYESAARLRSVAAAFTNVAITFLRNYRQQHQQQSSRKRRRSDAQDEPDDLPELYPPASTAVQNPDFSGVTANAAAVADDELQTAAFLRWQNAAVMAMAQAEEHVAPDMDALVSEPLGFQMRMEMGGPLDFDWFGWEEAQGDGMGAAPAPGFL